MSLGLRRRPGLAVAVDGIGGDGTAEFATPETAELARLVRAERVMVRIRWGGVLFAIVQVLTYYLPYPPGMLPLALALVALLAAGNIAVWGDPRDHRPAPRAAAQHPGAAAQRRGVRRAGPRLHIRHRDRDLGPALRAADGGGDPFPAARRDVDDRAARSTRG